MRRSSTTLVVFLGIASAVLSGCSNPIPTPGGVVLDAQALSAYPVLPGTDPRGNFESAAGVDGGVQIKGWMLDPDTPNPLYAWVTIDGAGRHLYANGNRPDIAAAFPGYGSNHGFQGTIPAPAGSHRVCVTASNTGPGNHTSLGCRIVSVPSASPFGNFERATGVAGGVEVKGWTADPSSPTTPLYAWVTVDGVGRHVYANRDRPDVGAAFPGYGSSHGLLGTVPASPGAHRVCVTAANIGAGSHTPLGCRTVSVPETSPFGSFERARATVDGIEVKGWMADPSAPTTPLYAWVTIDGVGRHLYANGNRADVDAAFPAYGPNHGFRATIPAAPGTHRVCVTAANVGPGSHTSLGCRNTTINAPGAPWRFTAEVLELAGADGPILTDPTGLATRFQTEGSSPRPAAVIQAGTMLVTAARPGPSAEDPAVLVGIDADTGMLAWIYEPAAGLLLNCASTLLAGELACLVSGSSLDDASTVVLLDPASGEVTGGFALSGPADALTIADGDLIVLIEVDLFSVYDVARYTAAGALVWSVREDIADELLPGDVFTFVLASPDNETLGVQIFNVVRVLDLDDGAVLGSGGGGPEEPDLMPVEISGGRVVTVDGSGALVAVLG